MIKRFAVPVGAASLAVKVRVELPFPGDGMVWGLKLAETPVGKPEMVSDKSEEKATKADVVTVALAELF